MTSRIPSHRRIRTVAAAGAAGLLFFAACEMTPRGGPTPTEPTLDDLVGPTAVDENRIVEVDFSVTEVDFEEGVVATQTLPDGRAMIARIDANGDTTWIEGQRVERSAILTRGGANPLVIVDGEQVASLDGVDPTTILEVNVIKGPAAVELHGPEAADGVIVVRTRGAADAEVGTVDFNIRPEAQSDREVVGISVSPKAHAASIVFRRSEADNTSGEVVRLHAAEQSSIRVVKADSNASSPIFLVDGVRVESIETMDPSSIERIEVIKDATALERFGPDAVHGAVLVTRKK